MRRLAWIVLLIGCGGGSDPPSALPFLRVGVQPGEEADAMISGLVRGGWEVARRVDGERAVAVALVHRERGESTVRVVTRRGVALTVDVPGEVGAASVGIAEQGVRDVTGDGHEEVFLWRADPVHERRCHAVVRVDDAGYVAPVPARLEGFGDQACVEAFRDLDGDGTPEALVVWRMVALAREAIPSVPVPFAVGDEIAAAPSRFATFVEAENADRARALAEARDLATAYALAVELAALARVRGAPMREQVAAFDGALAGRVLDEADAQAIRVARERIAEGW